MHACRLGIAPDTAAATKQVSRLRTFSFLMVAELISVQVRSGSVRSYRHETRLVDEAVDDDEGKYDAGVLLVG